MKGEEGVGGGMGGVEDWESMRREAASEPLIIKREWDGFKLWQKTRFVRDFSKEGWVEEEEGVKNIRRLYPDV